MAVGLIGLPREITMTMRRSRRNCGATELGESPLGRRSTPLISSLTTKQKAVNAKP
jgi:hypothetical protein